MNTVLATPKQICADPSTRNPRLFQDYTFDPPRALKFAFPASLVRGAPASEPRQHGGLTERLLTDQGRDAVLLPARIMLRVGGQGDDAGRCIASPLVITRPPTPRVSTT